MLYTSSYLFWLLLMIAYLASEHAVGLTVTGFLLFHFVLFNHLALIYFRVDNWRDSAQLFSCNDRCRDITTLVFCCKLTFWNFECINSVCAWLNQLHNRRFWLVHFFKVICWVIYLVVYAVFARTAFQISIYVLFLFLLFFLSFYRNRYVQGIWFFFSTLFIFVVLCWVNVICIPLIYLSTRTCGEVANNAGRREQNVVPVEVDPVEVIYCTLC